MQTLCLLATLVLGLYLVMHGLYLYLTLPDGVLRDEDEHPIPGLDGTRRATIIRDVRLVMVLVGGLLCGLGAVILLPLLRQQWWRRLEPPPP